MAIPTKEEMRQRFWVLKKAIDAAKNKTADLRAQYEPEWNAAIASKKAQLAEIRQVEADIGVTDNEGQPMSLYDAEMEQAFYARGLGNVGADPELKGQEPETV